MRTPPTPTELHMTPENCAALLARKPVVYVAEGYAELMPGDLLACYDEHGNNRCDAVVVWIERLDGVQHFAIEFWEETAEC